VKRRVKCLQSMQINRGYIAMQNVEKKLIKYCEIKNVEIGENKSIKRA